MSVGKKLAAHNGYATPRACVQFHEDAADAPNVLQRLKGLRSEWSLSLLYFESPGDSWDITSQKWWFIVDESPLKMVIFHSSE